MREPAPAYTGLPAVWRATTSPARETPLLLDTHVWLWTLDGTEGTLATAARTLIQSAAAALIGFLLAHAQRLGASLMTCDRGIITYAARAPGISVCDARA